MTFHCNKINHKTPLYIRKDIEIIDFQGFKGSKCEIFCTQSEIFFTKYELTFLSLRNIISPKPKFYVRGM